MIKPLWATLALLPILVSAAGATTINFSGLNNASGLRVDLAPSGYDVDGFTFTGTLEPGVWPTGTPDIPVGGLASVSLSTYFAGGMIQMTQDTHQTFSISSIDTAQWGASEPGSTTYTATFIGYNASHVQIASQACSGPNLAGQPVLTTCHLSGFNDIYSMEFTEGSFPGGVAAQFTNIVVNESNATPEPGSIGLALSGCAAFVAAVRRRKA